MNHLKNIGLFLVIFLLLQSCNNSHIIEEGSFKGMQYKIFEKEIKGFSTNRLEYQVKLGNLPKLSMDANFTDWGPVYSDDIFMNDDFAYIPQLKKEYLNSMTDQNNFIVFNSSMLYISPKKVSKEDYKKYKDFFQNEWAKIDKKYADSESSFPKIMGVVYGEQNKYTKIFEGNLENQKRILVIENDGRIRHFIESLNGGETGSNLSDMVQMPGKIIYIDLSQQQDGYSLELLKTFKDKEGKNPTNYFQIITQ